MADSSKEKTLKRSTGLLFPVFSMRGESDLGIGDTSTVIECLDWLSASGVGFLQLLPINMCGSDNSPYSAISSVALDFVYLDLAKVPELEELDYAGEQREWMKSDEVDYGKVREIKARLLKLAYERYSKAGLKCAEFNQFMIDEAEWLHPYTRYRWLMEQAGEEENWMTWPSEFNTPQKALAYEQEHLEDSRVVREYYAWEQWHAFSQWRKVREHADLVGVKLMGDIPIGVSCSSADVFFEPQWFVPGWFGGAPPEKVFKDDPFTSKWGQNWGVPIYDWAAHRASDFSWWRRRIEKLTDIFNMFRIDHILGFYRIYSFPWHPSRNAEFLPMSERQAKMRTGGELPQFTPRADDSVANKAQNLKDGDIYLKAVLEAAGDSEVVGEDLGCVPDYVRPHLTELGIPGFKVCQWEKGKDGGVVMPDEHPECAFVTYTTHDHPSIKALWKMLREGAANEDKAAIEQLKMITDYAELELEESEETELVVYPDFNTEMKWQMVEALLSSKGAYTALMITDLFDSEARINVPGTVGKHNWSYRVDWSFSILPIEHKRVMGKLADMIARYARSN